MASHGHPSRNIPSGPLLVHSLQPIHSRGSTSMRPNGGWSASGTQYMIRVPGRALSACLAHASSSAEGESAETTVTAESRRLFQDVAAAKRHTRSWRFDRKSGCFYSSVVLSAANARALHLIWGRGLR